MVLQILVTVEADVLLGLTDRCYRFGLRMVKLAEV